MQDRFQKALSVLRSGGVIAHATETCYGFACDAFNEDALKRLYALKKMPLAKPASLMVANLAMAKKYGCFNKTAEKMAEKFWPGPLTIIVKRKKTLPGFLNPAAKTVGFRVSAHVFSRKLAEKLGRPITTTSANISGQPCTYSASVIRKQFRKQTLKPDLIIDAGRLKKKSPSTVADMSGRKIKVIRQGDIKLDRL